MYLDIGLQLHLTLSIQWAYKVVVESMVCFFSVLHS